MHPQFTQLSVITFGGSIISDATGNDGNSVRALSHPSALGKCEMPFVRARS